MIPRGMGDNIYIFFLFNVFKLCCLFFPIGHPIGTFHPLLNVRESAVTESGTTCDEMEFVRGIDSPVSLSLYHTVGCPFSLGVCLFPPPSPMSAHVYE